MTPAYLFPVLGLAAGIFIGYTFGLFQAPAAQGGQAAGGLKRFFGAYVRMLGLLVALVAMQLTSPMFFAGNTKWWISGGILLAYGWQLTRRIMRARKTAACRI
ncbi:MAG: hypothetical protein HYV95_00190 [Opitutae bacterium]|nr:hypothetical protein [Opitutae bacterium]